MELIREVEKFEIVCKDRTRGKRFMAKIKRFSDQLSPYFTATGTIVQINPDVAGLAWGALRLVLKVDPTNNSLQFMPMVDEF
jgi:hypothetical protein